MEFLLWHYWFIAAMLFFILEIFIPSFMVFNFGIGALFGTIFSAIGWSPELQIIVFCVGTLISFFAVRPLILKYGYKRSHNTQTNIDAMAGRTAKVIEPVNNRENTGRVKLDGDDWLARSTNGTEILPGEMVTVERVESIVLFVKKST